MDKGEKPDTEMGVALEEAGFFSQRAESEMLDQTMLEAMVPDLPVLRMAYLIERDFAEFYEMAAGKSRGGCQKSIRNAGNLGTWSRGIFQAASTTRPSKNMPRCPGEASQMERIVLMSHSKVTTNVFADQVRAIPGGEHLDVCFACGTCVSKCMIQQKVEPEYNPRKLIRMVMMGMQEAGFQEPDHLVVFGLRSMLFGLSAGDSYLGGDRRSQAVGHRSQDTPAH